MQDVFTLPPLWQDAFTLPLLCIVFKGNTDMYLHHSTSSLQRLCQFHTIQKNSVCGKISVKTEMMTHYWSIPCRRDLLISSISLISAMLCIFVIWQSYPTILADELSSSRCQSMLMQFECYQVFIWQGNPAHRFNSPRHMYILYDRIWEPGKWEAIELKWQKMSHCFLAISKLPKHA